VKKSNSLAWLIVFLILTVIGVSFYWWQIRPSQIRKTCVVESGNEAVELAKIKARTDPAYKETASKGMYKINDYDELYWRYLNQRGLKSDNREQELSKVIDQQQQEIDTLKKSNEQYQKNINDALTAIEEYNKKIRTYSKTYPTFTTCSPSAFGGINCHSY